MDSVDYYLLDNTIPKKVKKRYNLIKKAIDG
jgi:hypothetical protein